MANKMSVHDKEKDKSFEEILCKSRAKSLEMYAYGFEKLSYHFQEKNWSNVV